MDTRVGVLAERGPRGSCVFLGSRVRGGPEKSARPKRKNPDTDGLVDRHVSRQKRRESVGCLKREGERALEEVGDKSMLDKSSFGKGQPGVLASSHGRSAGPSSHEVFEP